MLELAQFEIDIAKRRRGKANMITSYGKVRPIFDQFSRKHFTVAPRAKTPRTIRPLTYATTSFVAARGEPKLALTLIQSRSPEDGQHDVLIAKALSSVIRHYTPT
ncbi:hypothetical protein AcV5_004136 [Taiwanofungus camphoratus]|nr:hypothetical protein AcV5_004136 [Antrodia cinnamomea]